MTQLGDQKMAATKKANRSGARAASKPKTTVAKATGSKSETLKDTKTSAALFTKSAEKSEIQTSLDTVSIDTTKPTFAKESNAELGMATTMEFFKMNNFEVPFAIREVAEKSVEQARETYEKVKSATEATSTAMQESAETSRKQVVKINEKVLDAAKTNTSSTFEFCKDVIAVKSLSEVFELQTGFAQKQYAAAAKQGEELQGLVSKFVTEFTAPAKAAFENTFGAVAAN